MYRASDLPVFSRRISVSIGFLVVCAALAGTIGTCAIVVTSLCVGQSDVNALAWNGPDYFDTRTKLFWQAHSEGVRNYFWVAKGPFTLINSDEVPHPEAFHSRRSLPDYAGKIPFDRQMIIVSCGWPFPFVYGCRQTTRDGLSELHGLYIDPRTGHAVPYRVHLKAAIQNVMILGAPVGLIGLLALAFRMLNRRRRGRCLVCGYSLSGLPQCPECGVAPRTCR